MKKHFVFEYEFSLRSSMNRVYYRLQLKKENNIIMQLSQMGTCNDVKLPPTKIATILRS